jgi:hypothetical protein
MKKAQTPKARAYRDPSGKRPVCPKTHIVTATVAPMMAEIRIWARR